jgi:hypothetical protein
LPGPRSDDGRLKRKDRIHYGRSIIESTPAFVKVGLSRSEAEKIQQQLADAGAIVLIAHH